jgi:hypothetical protein
MHSDSMTREDAAPTDFDVAYHVRRPAPALHDSRQQPALSTARAVQLRTHWAEDVTPNLPGTRLSRLVSYGHQTPVRTPGHDLIATTEI